MVRGFTGSVAVAGFLALVLNTFTVAQAYAEFPPEGAVSDPNNPSVATGDLPDPTHKGTLRHYVFYFDCGKRDWIGVSVAGTAAGPTSPPQAVGLGREFPPGPPLGSKTIGGSPNRAMTATGQTFVLEDGNWIDAKTKKTVRSPKLCPGSIDHPGRRPAAQVISSEHSQSAAGAGGDKLPPVQPAWQNDQKPDQLPPPPRYNPDH